MTEWLYEAHEEAENEFEEDLPRENENGIAQAVVIGGTGTDEDFVLTRLEIRFGTSAPANNAIIELREWDTTNNRPGNNVIARALGSDKEAGEGSGWWKWDEILNYPTLRRNTTYALVIIYGESSNLYLDPDASYISTDYKAFKTTDKGRTWISFSDELNFFFRLYGESWGNEIINYPELIALAGLGVNETAKSFNNASIYASNAEGFINAITRYNWAENWNTLDEKAKKIIKEAMTTLAAVYMVNYDVSGYASRFEAQYISDALQLRADRAIAALTDLNIQRYIKTSS
jgi:hypothetical protein